MISKNSAVPRRFRPGPTILLFSATILLALALLPVSGVRAEPFADPVFEMLWGRTDLPVANGALSRTWIWGPLPGPSYREPYAEGAGGTRLVQYFDKGRMEINNPSAAPEDPFYVTSGLLTVELIAGRVQLGDNTYESRLPAQIPVAGDRGDRTAPTYASFLAVADAPSQSRPAQDSTSQPVNFALARSGQIAPLAEGKSDYGVTYAQFVAETNHNIPGVFWDFLNSEGPLLIAGDLQNGRLFDPWFKETGYPISEAYWSTVEINGAPSDVLIQAYQRRVLTYVPGAEPEWRVEMGNIGLHYLEWRYGNGGDAALLPAPTGAPTAPVSSARPAVAITAIETGKQNLDLNSQSITIVNNDSREIDLGRWRIDSPKPNFVDVYNFPATFRLAVGATVVVYAGSGADGPDRLYMRRVSWLFDANGYDAALLYDSNGREVSRFVLNAGVAPTAQPAPEQPTATETPIQTEPTTTATETPLEPPTATETPSGDGALPTETPGDDSTATPTVTGTPPTATATLTITATGTATATGTPTVTPTAAR